jgi:hypothetical protein
MFAEDGREPGETGFTSILSQHGIPSARRFCGMLNKSCMDERRARLVAGPWKEVVISALLFAVKRPY